MRRVSFVTPKAARDVIAPVRRRRIHILRPILGDSVLRIRECNRANPNLHGEVVLDAILDLEEALRETDIVGTALGPDVIERIRAPQFQRHQVIKLARLLLARVVLRTVEAVLNIGRILLRPCGRFIALAAGLEFSALKDL